MNSNRYKVAYMGVLMTPHVGQEMDDFSHNVCLVSKACTNMDRIEEVLTICTGLLALDGKNTKKMVKELLEELLEGIRR